ncbi:MAG: hypothetical protein HZB25_06740 [Candidatus Eisenbacteria bacterium]|nr:hypothetical protein [Candidatus Eisenbacteria bacterium]
MIAALILAPLLCFADADTHFVPVRLHQPGIVRGPRGRGVAVPLSPGQAAAQAGSVAADSAAGRATPRPAARSVTSWSLPCPGDTLTVRYERDASRESVFLRGLAAGAATTRHASASAFESVSPDTAWMGADINGDGQPDVVLRHAVRERPLTGQWIEALGLSKGRIRCWLTRTPSLVPKSLFAMRKGEGPLVFAVEPHAEGWPEQRLDPPARERLLEVRDSMVTDVSRRHAGWFAPRETAAALRLQSLEQRGEAGTEWADALLARTWCLLTMGRATEARVLYEGRLARARAAGPELRDYLEARRRELEQEWGGN